MPPDNRGNVLPARATRGFLAAVVAVIAILATQLAVAVFGAVLGEQEARRATLDTFSYVGELTASRVARHAEGARDVVEGTVVSIERNGGVVDLDRLARELYERLLREPQVRSLYVAFPDGSLVQVRRDDGGFVERRISPAPLHTVTDQRRDVVFNLVGEPAGRDPFDPRLRPWYLEGVEALWPTWTEPYLEIDTLVPTASATLSARINGEVVATVGADLSLSTFAAVLDELPVGHGAQAFILTRDRDVIAAPSEYNQLIAEISETTGKVPTATQLGLPDSVVAHLPADGDVFGTQGDRYILERAFPREEGIQWVLHLEADEQQLSPGLRRVQLTMAWVTGLSVLMVLIAGVVLYRLWQPLERLRRRASTDALTGLSNRYDFERSGQRLLHAAQRAGDKVVLVALDLDDFKALNDRHGHHRGDRALLVVAQALRSSVRETDLVARIGGDEFVVVHRGTDGDDVHAMVERIRSDVVAQLTLRIDDGNSVGMTAGYAVSDRDTRSLFTLLQAADIALMSGKRRAKGVTYRSSANSAEVADQGRGRRR